MSRLVRSDDEPRIRTKSVTHRCRNGPSAGVGRVRIALRCRGFGVTERATDVIERSPGFYGEGCKAVPEIVQAHVGDPREDANLLPGSIDADERLIAHGGGKYVLPAPLHRLQICRAGIESAMVRERLSAPILVRTGGKTMRARSKSTSDQRRATISLRRAPVSMMSRKMSAKSRNAGVSGVMGSKPHRDETRKARLDAKRESPAAKRRRPSQRRTRKKPE